MSKQYLGPRRVTAIADNTGNNTGNWTAVFDPATVAIHWSIYEVYKIVVDLTNAGSSVISWTVFIGQQPYEGFEASNIATWSDFQPMRVDGGETVYFYFNQSTTGTSPPRVTMWCQVDTDIARVV